MDEYIECNLYGTPLSLIEKIQYRQSIIGEFEQNICVRFGGIKQARRYMKVKFKRGRIKCPKI